MLRPVGDPPQTQAAVIVARCCSGVQSVSTAVWVTGAVSAAPSPHIVTHTPTHLHVQYIHTCNKYIASSPTNWTAEFAVVCDSCFCRNDLIGSEKCIYSTVYMTRQKAEGGRGDVVQYSLADVASHYAELQGVLIYYCGQWSMKSWRRAEKGAQIPLLLPRAAHISPTHPCCRAVPALVLRALAPFPLVFLRPRPPACDWWGCPAAADQL